MIHIQIDPSSGIPVYRQIMDQVRYYTASGTLRPGSQLPSIRELSKALSINPTTVVKAYSELAHAGVIENKHGKGVFVMESPSRMAPEEVAGHLRRIARQLAVEANQMKATREAVLEIVKEELEGMGGKGSAEC
ncbi:MAG: GntR family transcriptional regulator [Planctomycetota bacterium]